MTYIFISSGTFKMLMVVVGKTLYGSIVVYIIKHLGRLRRRSSDISFGWFRMMRTTCNKKINIRKNAHTPFKKKC